MSGRGDSQPQGLSERNGPVAFMVMAWRSGCCNLIPVLIFYVTGYTVMSPFLPDLLTDFFASKVNGSPIRCEDFTANKLPDACLQGSAINVQWTSVTAFFTNSVIIFLCAPMTGVWSDMIGRKPFLILSQFLSVATYAIVLLHVWSGFSLYAYYIVGVVNGAVSPSVVILAAVADVVPPRHRAAMFSITLGAFSAGFAVSPTLGIALGLKKAVALGVSLKALGILYTVLFVRETVSAETRATAQRKAEQQADAAREASRGLDEALCAPGAQQPTMTDFFKRACCACMQVTAIRHTVNGLSLIARNSEFVKLAASLMVASFVQAGLFDIETQYLLTLFGFNQLDFARVFMLIGFGLLFVQIILFPVMLAVLSERSMILTAFAGSLVKLFGLATASNKWQCYGAILIGSFYFSAYPVITSVKAGAVPEHEQGTVQGAIAGVQALATGCGPLLFMYLYRGFIQTDMPRLMMVVALLISIIPVVLVCFLDLKKLQRWKERNSEAPGDAAATAVCRGGHQAPEEEGDVEGAGEAQEPLLPMTAPPRPVHGLTGREILVEDAAMGHWEGDAAAGFAVQVGLLARETRPQLEAPEPRPEREAQPGGDADL
eukprot:jgi/Ulvmu1/10384/UM061_0068.1